MRRAPLVFALAAGLAGPATAQPARTPPVVTPPTVPPASTAPEPQRTTATFGDWTLRCQRPEHGPPVCEVGQTLFDKAQPVAQTALGRPNRSDPIRLTILVPVNVTLGSAVRMLGGEGESAAPGLELAWRRCVPAGCLADVVPPDEALRRIRSRTENARFVFLDGIGREATLPFSPRGLSQALDALAKEEQR